MAALIEDPSILASKRVVHVGGIADNATVSLVRAAMIPFGNIKSCDIPMDYVKGTHRGFAFVEFEDPDDAEEAIFNMDGSELLGKTIRVSLAQPNQVNKLSTSEAIWKSDDWYQKQVEGKDAEADAEQMAKVQDTKILHEL